MKYLKVSKQVSEPTEQRAARLMNKTDSQNLYPTNQSTFVRSGAAI